MQKSRKIEYPGNTQNDQMYSMMYWKSLWIKVTTNMHNVIWMFLLRYVLATTFLGPDPVATLRGQKDLGNARWRILSL